MPPQFLTGQGVETPDGGLGVRVAHRVSAVFAYRDGRKTGPDGSAPEDGWTLSRPGGADDLGRDAIAIWSAPLRPVFAEAESGEESQEGKEQQTQNAERRMQNAECRMKKAERARAIRARRVCQTG